MKQNFKCLLGLFLSLCLLCVFTPMAMAEGLTIPGATCQNGVWQLTSGTYTVSGTADSDESIEISGDVTLNLNGAALLHTTTEKTKYAPAISVNSGSAKLVLSGSNQVQGSAGFAGIYVAPGATLIISGDGSLNAKGGDGSNTVPFPTENDPKVYWSGGAGIGGNGAWVMGSDQRVGDAFGDFGTVIIESGSVTATGGKAETANAGGGAGIGSGGETTKAENGITLIGSIQINGGTVVATGGDGEDWSLTGGGAGLGSGGATGGFYTADSDIQIKIAAGQVTAAGTADGAGIGGGANVNGGVIEISGGNVQANGGYEIEDGKQSGGFGGAGIGGGDNGGVTSITISGGTVVARATGAAAGIGAGNSGELGGGVITLTGTADVTAYGGSHPNPTRNEGGAGIGGGRSYNYDSGFESITISGQAKVRAHGGKSAQSLGVGTYYGGDSPNKIIIDTTKTTIVLVNQDESVGAFWGQTADGTGLTSDCTVTGPGLIWYTGAVPPQDTLVDASSTTGKALKWRHTADKKIQVLDGDEVVAEFSYSSAADLGDWSTHLPVKEQPTPTPVAPGKVPPKTGDSTPLFLLAALLLLNGAVLVINLKKKKRV